MLQKVSRRILSYLKLRNDRKFLQKNGCYTWRQYNKNNDPRINLYANKISEFYFNYSIVHAFTDVIPFSRGYDDWLIALKDMSNWCEKNCKGKHRYDIHRVVLENSDITINNDYWFNDLGGYDYLFFAFEKEEDYAWFCLRWL